MADLTAIRALINDRYDVTAPNKFLTAASKREAMNAIVDALVDQQAQIDLGIPVNPVRDLTLTETWVPGESYGTLADAMQAAVRVRATFSETDTGILFEAGGALTGIACYLHGGQLHLTVGDGEGGKFDSAAVLSVPIPAGSAAHTVALSADASTGVAGLYLDDALVRLGLFRNDRIAGDSIGGLGRVWNTAPQNAGGWQTDGAGAFTGTIEDAQVFAGQVTPHVAALTTVPDLLRAPTEALSVTEAWTSTGTDYTALADQTRATVTADADVAPGSTGILFEAGGALTALTLVVHGGSVHARVGSGVPGADALGEAAALSWPIPAQSQSALRREVTVSADAQSGIAMLYVDRELVDIGLFRADRVCGDDAGGIGAVHGGKAGTNAGAWENPGQGAYSDTIYGAVVSAGQVTPDVAAFGAIPDFPAEPTDGLTVTEAWEVGPDYAGLTNLDRATVAVEADVAQGSDGIILEAGGTGKGVVLYCHENELRARVGNGAASPYRDTGVLSWPLPATQQRVEVVLAADATTGLAVLWVDRVVVDACWFEYPDLTGVDEGGLGAVRGFNGPYNTGGWQDAGEGAYPLTIHGADVYADQVPAIMAVANAPRDPVPVIYDPLAGHAADATWTTGSQQTGVGQRDRVSFRVTATFSESDTGVILDASNVQGGIVLYCHDGELRLRAGDHTGEDPKSRAADLAWPVPAVGDAQREIVLSVDAPRGVALLYVAGELVSHGAFDYYKATEFPDNGLGQPWGQLMRLPVTLANGGVFTGSGLSAQVYLGKVTADAENYVRQREDYLPDPTAGMTVDKTWTDRATNYGQFTGQQSATVEVTATFDDNDTGVLFESGAGGLSVCLSVQNGAVKLRFANGTNENTYGDLQWAVPTGASVQRKIVFSAARTPGRAALYVDRALVARTTIDAGSIALSDTNGAGIGEVHGGAPSNTGGWTADGQGAFTGAITQARIFEGEVTADVA